jgi:hypothetical protein
MERHTVVPKDVVAFTALVGIRTEVETKSGRKIVLDLSAEEVEKVLHARGRQVAMAGEC